MMYFHYIFRNMNEHTLLLAAKVLSFHYLSSYQKYKMIGNTTQCKYMYIPIHDKTYFRRQI